MYHLIIKPSAEKQLDKLSAKVYDRVKKAVDGLIVEPRPRGAIKLKGEENLGRIRVGDYGVVYMIEDDKLVVLVVRVAHRKDVYQE